jgi:hypothetical protein
MSIFDTLIIYLACGSPFGVYQMTQRDRSAAASWANAMAAFTLWPFFLTTMALRRISHAGTGVDIVEAIRTDIEAAAFGDGAASGLFDFREIYNRYAGLAEACGTNGGTPKSAALVELAGRNIDVAAQCLSRRDRAKLEFHHTIARNEFIEMIAAMKAADHNLIVKLALQLCEHLNDDDASSEIKAMTYDPAPRRTDGPQAEKWNTKIPSTTNIS